MNNKKAKQIFDGWNYAKGDSWMGWECIDQTRTSYSDRNFIFEKDGKHIRITTDDFGKFIGWSYVKKQPSFVWEDGVKQ